MEARPLSPEDLAWLQASTCSILGEWVGNGVGLLCSGQQVSTSSKSYITKHSVQETCYEFILVILNREETILQASQLKKSARRRGLQVRIATRQESHLIIDIINIIFVQKINSKIYPTDNGTGVWCRYCTELKILEKIV